MTEGERKLMEDFGHLGHCEVGVHHLRLLHHKDELCEGEGLEVRLRGKGHVRRREDPEDVEDLVGEEGRGGGEER